MSVGFQPPSIEQLATVDVADCQYNLELLEILGVVSLSGQASSPTKENYSVHYFQFASWRKSGEPPVNRSLVILRPVAKDSDDWFTEFREGAIQKIRVLLSLDETRAVFFDSVEKNAIDSELQAYAEELRKPVIIESPQFGALNLDRRIDWFEGTANWNGTQVKIRFNTDESIDIESQLETAKVLFADSALWGKRIDDFTIKEILQIARDWQEVGEAPITDDEFRRRMKLKSIVFDTDGKFEFWYDDGNLFLGHSILVRGSIAVGLYSAEIAG